MSLKSNCVLSVVLLLFLVPVVPALAEHGGAPEPQTVLPIFNQTRLDPTETYVVPSATQLLTPGHRLDLRSDLQLLSTPFVVQRLTDRTYFIEINLYSATAFVGDQGVLLIDCGGHGGPDEAQALIDAVASITPLPITHLVYSHPHTDHVGNSVLLKQAFPDLEIIASQWAADEIEMFGYPIATPTRTVKDRNGNFKFEGWKFRMVTPVSVAHTPADSYIVTPDRVMHVVDFVHAGRLTFLEASVVQNLDGFILFLRHLAGEEGNYDFLNPGHLNVAYPRDVTRALEYYEAMYLAWWESVQELPMDEFVDPAQDNAVVWLRNYFDAVAEKMFHKLAPAFGHIRFFEVARDHASKVHENQFLHRLNGVAPPNFGPAPTYPPIPSFEPIPPSPGQ